MDSDSHLRQIPVPVRSPPAKKLPNPTASTPNQPSPNQPDPVQLSQPKPDDLAVTDAPQRPCRDARRIEGPPAGHLDEIGHLRGCRQGRPVRTRALPADRPVTGELRGRVIRDARALVSGLACSGPAQGSSSEIPRGARLPCELLSRSRAEQSDLTHAGCVNATPEPSSLPSPVSIRLAPQGSVMRRWRVFPCP